MTNGRAEHTIDLDHDPLALPGDPQAAFGAGIYTPGQQAGPFADYAGLVRELAGHNAASLLAGLPWAELDEMELQLAELRAQLSLRIQGAPCNNRLGLIREAGAIGVAARRLLDADLQTISEEDYEAQPRHIQRTIALYAAEPGEMEHALLKLVHWCAAEAERYERWIERAEKEQCHEDYTPIMDAMMDAIEEGRRWSPESHATQLDFYGQRLIAMCKVSESGYMRNYIADIFQRRGRDYTQRAAPSARLVDRIRRRRNRERPEEEEEY